MSPCLVVACSHPHNRHVWPCVTRCLHGPPLPPETALQACQTDLYKRRLTGSGTQPMLALSCVVERRLSMVS
jgi:hypothetical protein